MVDSIYNIALNSINIASTKANSYAQNLSNFNENTDIVSDIIGMNNSKRQVQASAELIKVTQNMQNTILDIFA